MKQGMTAAALAVAVCLGGIGHALTHGGNYGGGTFRGPGDTVPTGGTPGSGGGPSTPGAGAPSTPGPSGPTTPGSGPGLSGPATPGGGGRNAPSGPSTGPSDVPQDPTQWQIWWELNKEPYLDVRRHIYSTGLRTGSDEFFLRTKRRTTHESLRPSEECVRDSIVPALLGALESEKSNDVITGSLIALAKIGEPEDSNGRWSFRDRIATFLTHSNQEVAETAALSLGILGDTEQAELLTALLNDDRSRLAALGTRFKSAVPERTRAFAAYGLGLLGAGADRFEASDFAIRLADPLRDESRTFASRDVPVACVLAFGLVALPPAADGRVPPMENGEFVVREHQVEWLLERFRDRRVSPLIRSQMPRSLARLSHSLADANPARVRVVEALLEGLEGKAADNDVYVQQSCVLALGQLGDCDADALDTRVRAALIRAHSQCSDQQSKRFALISLAQVCGRAGEGDALAGLRAKKDEPRGFLVERLTKGASGERCWAALALGVLERELVDRRHEGSVEIRTLLRKALGGAKSGSEVGAYSIALGMMLDRDALPVMVEKLESVGDPEARGYVALALGMLGDSRASGPVQAVVSKSKYQAELLRSAAIALALIGDVEAVPRLAEMLASANSLSAQAAIASALGAVGDSRSVDPLLAMLAKPEITAAARGFAAAALGIVADSRAHAWIAVYSLDINYRAATETLNSADGGTGLLQLL